MQIGSYKLFTIETGKFALDGGAMFGVVPKTLWEKRIPPDSANRIDMRLRCLLLQGEGRNILIDCGMGHKWSKKLASMYALDYSEYTLEKSLAAHRLTKADITDVVITHLHFDHAGGCTEIDGDKIVPTFPSATYYVQKENLEWAENPKEKDRASYMPENWKPLQREGVLKVVDGEMEILSGIHVRRFYGHTQGIQLPLLTGDGGNKVFFCGDVIPTSIHLGIPWVMAYDNFPLITIEEKKKILKQAADENWVLVFEHCPHVAASRIEPWEKGYRLTEKVAL